MCPHPPKRGPADSHDDCAYDKYPSLTSARRHPRTGEKKKKKKNSPDGETHPAPALLNSDRGENPSLRTRSFRECPHGREGVLQPAETLRGEPNVVNHLPVLLDRAELGWAGLGWMGWVNHLSVGSLPPESLNGVTKHAVLPAHDG